MIEVLEDEVPSTPPNAGEGEGAGSGGGRRETRSEGDGAVSAPRPQGGEDAGLGEGVENVGARPFRGGATPKALLATPPEKGAKSRRVGSALQTLTNAPDVSSAQRAGGDGDGGSWAATSAALESVHASEAADDLPVRSSHLVVPGDTGAMLEQLRTAAEQHQRDALHRGRLLEATTCELRESRAEAARLREELADVLAEMSKRDSSIELLDETSRRVFEELEGLEGRLRMEEELHSNVMEKRLHLQLHSIDDLKHGLQVEVNAHEEAKRSVQSLCNKVANLQAMIVSQDAMIKSSQVHAEGLEGWIDVLAGEKKMAEALVERHVQTMRDQERTMAHHLQRIDESAAKLKAEQDEHESTRRIAQSLREQVEAHGDKLEAKERETKKLSAHCEQLGIKAMKLQEALSDAERRCSGLTNELAESIQLAEAHETELHSKISVLEDELYAHEATRAELTAAKESLSGLVDQCHTAESNLAQSLQRSQELEEALAIATSGAEAERAQFCEELRNAREDLVKAKSKASAEREDAEKRTTALEKQIKESRAQESRLTEELWATLLKVRDRMAKDEKALKKLEAHASHLDIKIGCLHTPDRVRELGTKLLEHEKASLERVKAAQEEAIRVLRGEYDAKLADKDNEVTVRAAALARPLEDRVKELTERDKEAMQRFKRELEVCRQRVRDMDEEYKGKVDELRVDAEKAMRRLHDELDSERESMEALSRECADAVAREKDLKAQLSKLLQDSSREQRHARETARDNALERERLEARLLEAQNSSRKEREKIETRLNEVQCSSRKEREDLEARLLEIQNSSREEREVCDKIKVELRQAQAEIKRLGYELDIQKDVNKQTERIEEEHKRKLAKIKVQGEKEIAGITRELADRKKEVDRLSASLAVAKNEMDELRSRVPRSILKSGLHDALSPPVDPPSATPPSAHTSHDSRKRVAFAQGNRGDPGSIEERHADLPSSKTPIKRRRAPGSSISVAAAPSARPQQSGNAQQSQQPHTTPPNTPATPALSKTRTASIPTDLKRATRGTSPIDLVGYDSDDGVLEDPFDFDE